MIAQWLHALQQFQFSIIHQPGRDHGNADSVSRVPASPCRQCTRQDCPPVVEVAESVDQPFDSESTGSSEDTDLIPIHSGEDWVAQLDYDLSQPTAIVNRTVRNGNNNRAQCLVPENENDTTSDENSGPIDRPFKKWTTAGAGIEIDI